MRGGIAIPIQVYFVWLIGLVFIYFGYLVFSRKAPGVLDYFLKLGITAEEKISAKFFGSVIAIIGIVIMLLPFILGIDNMNL
ncbi:hypothetical protein QNH47_06280 [Virgibacillus halodenitrificans]|uniref:hypothetical protein n=1 Tax=Virgibacillus halodenitrificans TaxID=1482 RepID=UPI0024C0638B|nr:hypothetical protein [Virgibacillus halodenitrificans]WHX27459.1 hypothetical protein QNH47_06280 [Virgibacillus halodenitrificans]